MKALIGFLKILVLVAVTCLVSCDEVIEPEIKQAGEKYVVSALVTNEDTLQYVRITRTASFYSEGYIPGVSNAIVRVLDDSGNTFNYVEDSGEKGFYYTQYKGSVGKTYTLHITLPNGEVLTATDYMYSTPGLDSLGWAVNEEERENPDDEGKFYDLTIYATEPQETKDYYLFKFYTNGEIENFDGYGIFYSDDEYIAENIEGLDGPVFYSLGDTVMMEMYSLSREAYVFYSDLDQVLNGDGGMLGASPANPRSNIQNTNNLGLGLFQVSAVDRKSVIVGVD